MSYRLDEGRGRCTYHVGVEDDGCHSLLDYPSVSESAWILEGIARGLNAVVVTRRMIQNEIQPEETGDGAGQEDGVAGQARLRLTENLADVLVVDEPPVLSDRPISSHCNGYSSNRPDQPDEADKNTSRLNGVEGEEEKKEKEESEKEEDETEEERGNGEETEKEKANGESNPKTPQSSSKHTSDKAKLCTEEGSYTRCELIIQRVETHLLDPSPLSLSSLSRCNTSSSSFGEGNAELLGNKLGSSLTLDGKKKEEEATNVTAAAGVETNPTAASVTRSPISTAGNPDAAAVTDEEDTPTSVEDTLSHRNIRIAVVGNVDAGKSTLIGTLTTSRLDDGRGSSRTSIMKHRHEIESGRTSTSSSHLLGFKRSGEVVAGRDRVRSNKRMSEDEVARASHSIVTLMDLAGHEKYLKTTIHGVSCGMADYALILVNSRHPPTHMTQHHLNLCCSYGIPVVVVFTKVDNCPEHALATSRKELAKLLKSPDIGKRPFAIKTAQDVETCVGKLHTLAPMVDISCVRGDGLDLLRQLLYSLPKRRKHEKKVARPFEFLVEDVFNNVPGVGSVVSGFVNAGELDVGNTTVYIGPTDDGTFIRTVAKSAHIARINTARITSGQSATLAFALNKEMRKKLRRGMVVMRESPAASREFDAEICVLRGEGTTIRKSYQAYVHILNVRQTAFAKDIEIVNHHALGLPPSHGAKRDTEGIVLRPGSRAKVRFEFAKRPVRVFLWPCHFLLVFCLHSNPTFSHSDAVQEYIRPGMRMLFRDGRVRGVGIITGIPCVAAA